MPTLYFIGGDPGYLEGEDLGPQLTMFRSEANILCELDGIMCPTVWKSKFYGAFVLNRRVDLHAIDATPARWRGDAGSSPLGRASTAASSPRNDLSEELSGAPDALVNFHTGEDLSLIHI